MKSERFGEHLVNTLVNTSLREVNTMNSLSIYTHFSNIKIKVYKGIHKCIHVCVYVLKARKVFTNRRKLFTKPFIKCSLNCSFFGRL